MDYCLLIAQSATRAQQMLRILRQCGIRADIVRAPTELSGQGCRQALRVRIEEAEQARQCLRKVRIFPVKVFCKESGVYREVEK